MQLANLLIVWTESHAVRTLHEASIGKVDLHLVLLVHEANSCYVGDVVVLASEARTHLVARLREQTIYAIVLAVEYKGAARKC